MKRLDESPHIVSHLVSQAVARFLVFFTSAAVLVIEILALRIVAPYVGVGLEVVTGIIGVILAGIAAGAGVGGRAADRHAPGPLLGPLLIGGGLTAVASPIIVDAVGPSLSADPLSIVLIAALGFILPAGLLSAVPPIVVKIRLVSLDETGAVVGSFSAIATAGALFGTFVTGFVLIAAFPTRPTMAALGLVLSLLGVWQWTGQRGLKSMAVMAIPLAVAGLALSFVSPCDYETVYSCAELVEDPDREGGWTLELNGARNSYVDLNDPTHLEFRYTKLIADVVDGHVKEGPIDVVSLGGGGFTMPGYYNATRPGSANVAVEIDGDLETIGRDELSLTDDTEVIVADARPYLGGLPDDSADVVIGDAFSGTSVPWHLSTVEFAQGIRRVLRPDGVYAMNIIDYGGRGFVRAEAVTLRRVFTHVALFAPPGLISGSAGGNYVLAASESPIDVDGIQWDIRLRGGNEIGIGHDALDLWAGDAAALTDDFAPVDQMKGRRG